MGVLEGPAHGVGASRPHASVSNIGECSGVRCIGIGMKSNITTVTRPPVGRGRRNRISASISAKDVSKVLRMIRPSLRDRGGSVELIDIEDTRVTVRLSGGREECPMSFSETSDVVERIVRSRRPENSEVAVV